MSKLASLKDIIERVNEKGESPLEVAAFYGISRDTLRRRMQEAGGFVIDNSSKKYHQDGKPAIPADYEGMEIELIRGKGNAIKKHMKNTPKARKRDPQDTHTDNTGDPQDKHMDNTNDTHLQRVQYTEDTRLKHDGSTSRKLGLTFEDFIRKDGKKLRMIIDAWEDLQQKLTDREVAAARASEIVSIQDRRMQLNTEASRTRRAYTISDEVWKKFDEIADGSRIQKGEALEIAIIDFIEKYQ